MDSDDDVVYGPTPGTRGIVGFEKVSPHIRRQTSADSSNNGAMWTSRGEGGGSVGPLSSVGRVHVSRRRRALGTGATMALGHGIDFGDVGRVGYFQRNDLLHSSPEGDDNDSVVSKVQPHSFESEDSVGDGTKEDDYEFSSQFSARCVNSFPSQKTASSTQNHTLAMELLQDRPAHWGASTQPSGWRTQTQRQIHSQSGIRGKVKGKGKRERIQGTSAFAPGGLKRERKNTSGLSSQQSISLSEISFRPSFMARPPSTLPEEIVSEKPPAEEIASDVESDEDNSSNAWTAPPPTSKTTTMSSMTVGEAGIRPPGCGKKIVQTGDKKRSGGIVADALQCACAEEDSSVARLVSGLFPLRENTGKVPDLADPRSKLTWSVDLVVSQISPMAPSCLWIEGNVEGASMLCGNNSNSSSNNARVMGPGVKYCGTAASLVVGEPVDAMFIKDIAQSIELVVTSRVRIYDPFVTWMEKRNKKVLLCTRKCEQSPPPSTTIASR